mgnify:CR=1 FL=1
MELLSLQGWNPVMTIDTLITHIKMALLEGNAEIDEFNYNSQNNYNYGLFSPDIITNIILIIGMMKKYNNIAIPYQHHFIDKKKYDVNKLNLNEVKEKYNTLSTPQLANYFNISIGTMRAFLKNNNIFAIKILIAHGANMQIMDNENKTCYMLLQDTNENLLQVKIGRAHV